MKTRSQIRRITAFLLICSLLLFTAGCGAAGASQTSGSSDQAEKKDDTKEFDLSTAEDSPEWVGRLKQAKDADQLFVVGGIGETTATVSMHEKDENGAWKQILSTPGYIGKNGLGKTKEGDGKTPMGTYSFNKAFGIAEDPGCAFPYQQVTDDDYWSGDDRDGYDYNHMVSIKDLPDLNTDASEHIVEYDRHYQYVLNISYNEKGEAGKGSAIFLHCLGPEKPYTGGCVAIPEDKMITVMQNVKEDCVVVIDSFKTLSPETWKEWELPGYEDIVLDEEEKSSDVTLSDDSSDFVLLSEVLPDAILEIRYYSTYNFVGDRIAGYEQPTALLTKEAAEALKNASDDLKKQGYRLKIFDAYRPQKAVTNFMEWAKDIDDTRMKEYFYPELDKSVLFDQGYIAEHSGHSRGSTVDLTLFDMESEKEVDMGGTFDYFGELSHPDYKGITDKQYDNRMILRKAMLDNGFKPLDEEWWHFTLEDEPYPDTYFTFPVNEESVTRDKE